MSLLVVSYEGLFVILQHYISHNKGEEREREREKRYEYLNWLDIQKDMSPNRRIT